MSDRPIPMLGSIALDAVDQIEHVLDAGFAATPIAGLEGELQQRVGRASHRIRLRGLLTGDGAADALSSLQAAAADGAEVSFSADITQALDLQQVVVHGFAAAEHGGRPGTWEFELTLAESPPLPPPAELSSFGGLGDFGLGDLGVDLGVLDDIAAVAGDIAGAVDAALDAINALSALSDLGSLGGVLEPLSRQTSGVQSAGEGLGNAARAASEALS